MKIIRTIQNLFVETFGGEFKRAARNFNNSEFEFIETRKSEFLSGSWQGRGNLILPGLSTFRDKINERRNRHTRFRFN